MSYVYVKSEPNLYTVGFYKPSGEWVSESDYHMKTEAAERVAYLNGSQKVGLTMSGPIVCDSDRLIQENKEMRKALIKCLAYIQVKVETQQELDLMNIITKALDIEI